MARGASPRRYSYRGSRGPELLRRAAKNAVARSHTVTREEVTAAALKLFCKKGFLGTSMADIADAVGLTKGGIYHHVESKEDLLRELHDEMIRAVFDGIRTAVEPAPDPRSRLVNWIRMHARVMHDYLEQISVFFRDYKHLQPASLRRLIRQRDEVQRTLAQIIRDGIACGQFRDGFDPDITALLILGTMNWFYQWYRPDGKLSLEAITRMAEELICKGVLREEARQEG
jgi:AcrR family transcriptional regulator